MTAIVTTTGEQFLNTVASADTPISEGMLADKIILAKVEGLDETTTPQDETFPAVTLHTFDVTRAAALNADAVLFSALLDSTLGDFEFNWMGLYNSEYDVLIAVAYEPTQLKIATNGEQVGNVMSKGFALNIKGAAQVLDIQTPLESWQFDFTGRQAAAENIQREAMRQVYGSATYVNDAATVTAGAAVYEVAAGTAIIDGLLVDISATQTDITIDTPVGSYPYYIYAEVSQQTTSDGVTNKVEIATSQSVLNNYVDAAGNTHALELIATLQDENTIIDNRAYVTDSLTLARAATSTKRGQVSLSNSTTSDSETEAATPKSVKSAKDAADSAASAASAAQSTADSAASAANDAQSTANTAVSNAATAQTTADSAASAASAAQSTADSAASAANDAQSTANTAVSNAATAQTTANARMIGSNNLNEITERKASRESLGIYTAIVNCVTEEVVSGPSGWTLARSSSGRYVLSHALNNTNYAISLTSSLGGGAGASGENMTNWYNKTSNSFFFSVQNSGGSDNDDELVTVILTLL